MDFTTIEAGLEAELQMLERARETGQSLAAIWTCRNRALVLPEPMARSPHFQKAARNSAKAGWPVVARRTGGGITPQGPGVVNLTLAFQRSDRTSPTVADCYRKICDPLLSTVSSFGVLAKSGAVANSFCDGDHNLHIAGQKFVGTAQRWRGSAVLCHALILTDIDLQPAVSAIQDLSTGLTRPEYFDPLAHTTLKQSLPDWSLPAFLEALWNVLDRRGAHVIAAPER